MHDQAVENPFWAWAVAAWQQAPVETLCIRLQDEFEGYFVPALLFAAWCVRERLRLEPGVVADLQLDVWRSGVIDPLRNARRLLRSVQLGQEDVYDSLKQAELQLEQRLMGRMYALSGALPAATEEDAEDLFVRNMAVLGMSPKTADEHALVDELAGKLVMSVSDAD